MTVVDLEPFRREAALSQGAPIAEFYRALIVAIEAQTKGQAELKAAVEAARAPQIDATKLTLALRDEVKRANIGLAGQALWAGVVRSVAVSIFALAAAFALGWLAYAWVAGGDYLPTPASCRLNDAWRVCIYAR